MQATSDEQDNYSVLPLEDRLIHRLWRARLEAYEELSKLFEKADSPKDPIYKQHWEAVRTAPSESNAAALESALACLLSFLKNSDSANKIRPMILSTLIEKGLVAAKPGVRARAIEALLLFVELDSQEPILNELTTFMNHKQPKLISACLSVMTEILSEFGGDRNCIKSVVKCFPQAFQHADKNVRQEGSNLTIEVFRWIGPAINSFLEPLKPIQVKELQEQFSKIESGKAQPKRYLKSRQLNIPHQAVKVHQESVGFNEITVEEIPTTVDAYDLADPVKVLDRIPATFQEMIESTKWKDRKDALDELVTLLKAPRLEDGHYGPLVQTLSKKLADANILVAISAANCITALSSGLRKGFQQYRVEVVPALLERCKEKKASVIEALRTCLDTLGQYSLPSMFDLIEMLTPIVSHKNPQVKAEYLSWLSRFPSRPATKKDLKPFLSLILPTIDDCAPEVREASTKLVAKLISVSGQSNVLPFLDSIDKNKVSKIVEIASSSTSAATTTEQKQPNQASNVTTLGKTRSAPPSTPAKTSQSGMITSTATPVTRPAPKLARKEISTSMRHSDDEAISVFEGFLDQTLFTGLSDTNWKTRLESLEAMMKVEFPAEVDAELLVRFLGQKPGWKESNFQVYQRIFQIIKQFMNSNGASSEALSLMALWASEKLADVKIGPEASECLLLASEYLGLSFVLNQVSSALKAQKSPKTQSEILKWIKGAMISFGITSLSINDLVDIIKCQIVSTNPTVRSTALSLAASVGHYFNSDIRTFLSDLSYQLLSSLNSEIERVAKESIMPPSRFVRSMDSKDSENPFLSSGQNSGTPSVEEDTIERVEFIVSSELIQQLGDAKWQQRKEALDQIGSALERSQGHIKLSNGDLINELKGRLSDSNKNLIIQALELCGSLGESCGSSFEKNIKNLLPSILSTLSDNKLQVRHASLKCLDSLHKACRLSNFLPSVVSSLSSDSPNLRREALAWTAASLKAKPDQISREDILPLINSCIVALQDRTMEVRKASQSVLSASFCIIPPEQVRRLCQDQRPDMMSVVQGLIDSHIQSVPSSQSQPIITVKVIGSGLFSANCTAEQKTARLEKDRQQSQSIIDLKEQMMGCLHTPLINQLFAEDFREHLNGLSQIDNAIISAETDEKNLVLFNLDLLLKYLASKLGADLTNPAVLNKCIEVLEHLITLVDGANARLNETEAIILLPSFIGRSGETKKSLRMKTRSIFRQLCRIYPASKMFTALVDGLRTKTSSRCRAVCLEEMQSLLARNGLVVINPSKHVPLIAGLLAEKDSNVRNAALDLMARLVGLMGDQLSKYLADLGQKELDLLEERLKHRPQTQEIIEPEQNVNEVEVEIREIKTAEESGPFKLDYDQFEQRDRERLIAMASSTPVTSNKLAQATPPYPFASQTIQWHDHPLDKLVAQIQSSSDLPCIHALQRLEEYLSPVSGDLKPRIDSLLAALCVRLRECSSAPQVDVDTELKSRLCRYVSNALVVVCSEPHLCDTLSEDTLIVLISETLHGLTSSQLTAFEDHEQLMRALNILLVKTLENAPINANYHALLILLEQAFRIPPSADDKYPEFVMKCLWKLTKQIVTHLGQSRLFVPSLLKDIHNFFCALPPVEWKTRAGQRVPFEDLPLRTVKTILHELVVAKGSEIIYTLSQVPSPEQSFVTSYLKVMLQAVGLEVPILPNFNEIVQLSEFVENEVAELTVEEIEARLKDICGKICSKPNTRSGLVELYEFQQARPYAWSQIDSYLEQLGSFFYKYIRRNLQQLDLELRSKDSSQNADLNVYKQKLAQMQQQLTSGEGGMVSADSAPFDGTTSPVRTRLESPFLKHSPAVVRTALPVKDSSIMNLKERLARLRTNAQEQQ